MAPLTTKSLVGLALWMLSVGWADAKAQGFMGQHPLQPKEPIWDDYFSFGHKHPLTPDTNKIPHYESIGHPQILSDRVILTPPHPGNQRAALWSEISHHNEDWELQIPFRAGGGERAGGSLHVWYTHRGAAVTGTSTIYTAKPFEGLALVIDSQGGHGMIRGFLNDGTTDYSIHHHPQSLAFGQCDAPYRNLGRPALLTVKYHALRGLTVEFDHRPCFHSDKIKLPTDYRFGVSAASAENPDSFEIFGFKVGVDKVYDKYEQTQKNDPQYHKKREEEERQRRRQEAEQKPRMSSESHEKFEYEDSDAKTFKSGDDQFKDIHLRLQALTHQIAEVQRMNGEMSHAIDSLVMRLERINERIGGISGGGGNHHNTGSEDRLYGIEQILKNLEASLRHEGAKIDSVHHVLRSHQEILPDHLKDAIHSHGPRLGFSLSLLIVFQVMLVIAYIVYKRRRNIAPKKYL